ncbi:MAG: metallophosphoesterase [Elusimicrobia bacterium RIFCSPLOWO2_01_FULL_59_12]|nr:MAG: metallophosphoesterase [Elusimicrobia bacterium RIFCSPLOWO2_01_FULL_59_12]
MKILFFGDIIGRAGREGLARILPKLREAHQPDFIIANAENAAHGKGLTPRIAEELWGQGIDVLTMGNHTLDKKEILSILDNPRLLRPANYASGFAGRGSGVYPSRSGKKVGVLQVMGRVYMPLTDCPFRTADKELETLRKETPIILVDLHAEITSEKAALGWHLDGRASAAIGTHTHIQTADERLLPGGTAFLTDAGACGPVNSIIGMDIKAAMTRFLTGAFSPLVVAEGDALVCGCVIEVDEKTGKARSIQRIREHVPLPATLPE